VRGFPPSFFATIPKLVERMGRTQSGSITGLLTVLVDGDDPNEPVSDTLRGLLDGHIHLSRSIAQGGMFPAVDVLQSLSRLMPSLTKREEQQAAQFVRGCLAAWKEGKDLVEIGAYRQGTNPRLDTAIAHLEAIQAFLRQDMHEHSPLTETRELLALLSGAGRS
jgi:flagellum-specific ATP synthase/type III secretion protein N (ATPase)